MNDFPELAVIIYDDLRGPAVALRDNMRDLTEFKLMGRYRLNLIHTQRVTETLREVTDRGFEWAVVVAVGTWLRNSQVEVLDTVAHARAEGVPLACHILHQGGYFHFHPQWFALDLRVYNAMGRPELEEGPGPLTFTGREILRSTDSAHDGYTPWWIRPGEAQDVRYSVDRKYFGLDLIRALIEAGHGVTNIPQKIRECKNYCYPNHQYETLAKMIADPAFTPEREGPTEAVWWFDQAIKGLVRNLNNGYYVINTEGITNSEHVPGRTFDCFIGVCGGQKPAVLVGQPWFRDDTKVVLYDVSRAALEFQQHLLATWDGDFDKFESVYQDFQSQHQDYMPMYFRDKSIAENVQWFYNVYGVDHDEFYRRWQKYRQCEFEFVHLDLHAQDAGKTVGEWSHRAQHSTYVWTSNAFYMDYQMFYKTKLGMHDIFLNFVNTLRDSAKSEILLENCNHVMVL